MNKLIWTLMLLALATTMLGCASRGNNCQNQTFGEWIRNRPRPLANLLQRGDQCDTCNAHAGQLSDFPSFGGMSCTDGSCGIEMGPITSGYYPSDNHEFSDAMFVNPVPNGATGSGLRNPSSMGDLVVPPMSFGGNN